LGLDIAIRHPEHITKLFAFAANSDPSGVKEVGKSPVFNEFIARAKTEYEQLSPTPEAYDSFLEQITGMWAAEPNFTAEELRAIKIPVLIVDADHDEAIKRENTEFMGREIPNAGLLLLPGVSHFALLQDPEQFNCNLQHFLQRAWLRP
jgi:pimeloyl-ACP methyl ester carboxylesterase